MFGRVAISCAVSHPLGALAVAVSTAPLPDAMGLAFLFSILGCFYLVPEAIFMAGAIRLLDNTDSRIRRVILSFGVVAIGALMGALLAFKVSGSVPRDYRIGYTVAGAIVGIVPCVLAHLFPRETKSETRA